MSQSFGKGRPLRGGVEELPAERNAGLAAASTHPEREVDAFLASIIESSNDAIVSKDLNGIITSWNPGAEHIFGFTAAEAIGKPITIIIPSERLQEETYILGRIRRGEPVEHFETVRRRKDGSDVEISLMVSPIRNASGKIIGPSKIARDIGEQHRIQERLRQSEERFRVTLSSIGDAVIATDKEGLVTFMNAVAEKLTGWSADEASGRPLDQIFRILNEVTRQPVETPVRTVIAKGIVVGLGNHTVLISKDGREIPIDDSAAPIRATNGDLAGVVLVFRDATQERAAALAARKLMSLIGTSEDAIYGADLNGIITDWNPAAERIFGYPAADVVGRSMFVLVPEKLMADETQILERVRSGESVAAYETVRRRKDGFLVDIALTVSPLKDPSSGKIVGLSKILRDITQQKQIMRELAQAHSQLEDQARRLEAVVKERTARLQQTVAELEAFSFTVSHDLRSPLRSMEGFAQALLSDYRGQLDARGQEYLQRIANSAVRLDKLILEVLAYGRVGQGELKITRVDLDLLVEDVLRTYPAIQRADARIAVEHPMHPVRASYASLVQCVSNLLANAVKFVAPGARPNVRVWTEKHEKTVRLYVRDEGIGVPANSLSKIFEPFQRAHPDADYEGTGMGLAIVRKAMERMGGGIGVESREGQGSTFWIELPAAE